MNAGCDSSEFLLNGQRVSIAGFPVQTTLLDFLRSRGLTGAKEGCAEGECGACSVVYVAAHGTASAYRPVNSCLLFLPMVAGQEIYTVESLAAGGELQPAQKAMAAAGGSQCGYCTPGFVMSLFAEHYRPDRTGKCDPHAMGGNLCRCTGYRPIRDAALSLGEPEDGEFLRRLALPAPAPGELEWEAAGVRFTRPATLEACVSAMVADPSAKLVAGGTDLGVESNLRGRRWPHLISLEAITDLREFKDEPQVIRIGAALPLGELEGRWQTMPAFFRRWLALFASPTIRNRATLGGNLVTGSPIGDGAPLLQALDASVCLAGPNGRRTVPLADFYTGYRQTVLGPGELVTALEIPKPLPAFVRFYKVAKRQSDDISTLAAGMALDWDERGRIRRARFAYGGVAAVPTRLREAEEALQGELWSETNLRRIQAILERTLHPISDHRGSAEYRLAVAISLVEKFRWECQECAA